MPVSPETLRKTMRHWASGVTVVTSSHGGVAHGMTVSSFTSVSLIPPTVLVSLEKTTRTHELVNSAGVFGVTFLSSSQKKLSERFAGRSTETKDRFKGLEIQTLVTGAPFLSGGLGFLDCRVLSAYEVGTHTVFVGEVVAALTGEGNAPLVHYDRHYRQLQDLFQGSHPGRRPA